jgi:tetratricopeptide (TPR) repeat protein
MGSADSARYYFTREIALHPQRVKGYTNLASLFLVSGDTAGAAQLCGTARSVRPFDPTAWRLTLRSNAGLDGDRLEILVDSAARATDDNIYVLNEAAAVLTAAGRVSVAEKLLKQAVETEPPPVEMNDDAFTQEFATGPVAWERQRGESHYQLGYLYGRTGRAGLAVSQSRAAIACDSNLIPAWINLASGLVALNQRTAADSVFTEALTRFGRERLAPFLTASPK